MSKSQNGWAVQNSTATLWRHPQAGPMLAGPVWVVLNWFMLQYALLVEPIGKATGCYNRRKIAGSTKWSNHASATAVDINWVKHPANSGRYVGYTPTQRAAVEKILKTLPVLRWGATFSDPMHYEIAPGVKPAQVEKLAVKLLQRALTAAGHPVKADGVRGPLTTAALELFQTSAGLEPDGVDGPQTWLALTTKPLGGVQ